MPRSINEIALCAVEALVEGDEDSHFTYVEELYHHCVGYRRSKPREVLVHAGLPEALAGRMTVLALDQPKHIRKVYSRLLHYVDREEAVDLVIKAFVVAATSEPCAYRRQRLFKAVCRNVSTRRVVQAFREAQVDVYVPSRLRLLSQPSRSMLQAVKG